MIASSLRYSGNRFNQCVMIVEEVREIHNVWESKRTKASSIRLDTCTKSALQGNVQQLPPSFTIPRHLLSSPQSLRNHVQPRDPTSKYGLRRILCPETSPPPPRTPRRQTQRRRLSSIRKNHKPLWPAPSRANSFFPTT